MIAVPLRYGARVTGVVFLSKLGVGQFDESDLRLLEVLAGYAAVSLENARLYESLRLEADHAKAWLEFADAISDAESAGADRRGDREGDGGDCSTARSSRCGSRIRDQATSRASPARAAEGRRSSRRSARLRLPRLAGESVPGGVVLVPARRGRRAHELFRSPELPPSVRSPSRRCRRVTAFAAGYASASRRPSAGSRTSGCGCWKGSPTATAMALQKARLARHREQSLHVADALLEYARALARDKGDDVEERIVRLAAEMLDASEVSLWLQAEPGAEMLAVAAWDTDEDHRALVLAASFPAVVAQPFSERPEPFVLRPEQYEEIPGAAELSRGGDVAVAPFTLDQGRMGFLVAGAPAGETFGELQLKMLAGLADQATLALS